MILKGNKNYLNIKAGPNDTDVSSLRDPKALNLTNVSSCSFQLIRSDLRNVKNKDKRLPSSRRPKTKESLIVSFISTIYFITIYAKMHLTFVKSELCDFIQ